MKCLVGIDRTYRQTVKVEGWQRQAVRVRIIMTEEERNNVQNI